MVLLKILFWLAVAGASYLYNIGQLEAALAVGTLAVGILAADIRIVRTQPAVESGAREMLDGPEWRGHKLAIYLALLVAALLWAPALWSAFQVTS